MTNNDWLAVAMIIQGGAIILNCINIVWLTRRMIEVRQQIEDQ